MRKYESHSTYSVIAQLRRKNVSETSPMKAQLVAFELCQYKLFDYVNYIMCLKTRINQSSLQRGSEFMCYDHFQLVCFTLYEHMRFKYFLFVNGR